MAIEQPTPEQRARLNAQAAAVLGLRHVDVETIPVRPISFEEVAAFAASNESVEFSAYRQDQVGFLLPSTVHTQPSRRSTDGVAHKAVYPAVPNRRDADVMVADRNADPVGYEVKIEGTTIFGAMHSQAMFTSREALAAANAVSSGGYTGHGELFVDCDEEHEGARLLPLMPVFGSMATVSFVVEGADADDLKSRVESLLLAEFGERLGRNVKVLTRPVANRRVDVYTADGTNRALAIGILEAETSMVMSGAKGAVETRSHQILDGLILGS